jgi:hypothetical protein
VVSHTAALVVTLGLPFAAAGQDPPPPTSAPVTGDQPAPPPKLAFGYLSDPKSPPADFLDALLTGKVSLDNRFRIERADTSGKDSATAITNRLRLGYESKPYHGFSGLVEAENVSTLDEDNYFVPATGDGTPTRTTVSDPTGTEMNQAYAKFSTLSLFDSGATFDLRAGRQRIQLDDDRFIGNVGWRQFEQTFDAVRVQSNLGIEGLLAQYAYVWHVQRIFGPDGPNWDSQSHVINVAYAFSPAFKVIPFAYFLDFDDDAPASSSDTLGLRLTGELWRDPKDDADLFGDYELTYARQSDAGMNAADYDADFFAAQGRLVKKGLGSVTLGYQFLGSDDGAFAFQFPLGTNHKFQGFADMFLTTPAGGVQDLYLGLSADLPWGISPAATFHQYWADEGGDDLGYEFNLVASKKVRPNWMVLFKAAVFDGHSGMGDTTKFWLETTFSF